MSLGTSSLEEINVVLHRSWFPQMGYKNIKSDL
jgi:hypothetical protein